MSKNIGIVLLVWNLLLTVLVGWSLTRSGPSQGHDMEGEGASPASDLVATTSDTLVAAKDPAALKDAKIAFFRMENIREQLPYFKTMRDKVTAEENRLQRELQGAQSRLEARYKKYMTDDHTYSTKAELEAEENTLKKMDEDIRIQAQEAQDQMTRLGDKYLIEFSETLQDFLKTYNEEARFDYIISLEPGGQVWPGNEDLDITDIVIAGLDKRFKEAKGSAPEGRK